MNSKINELDVDFEVIKFNDPENEENNDDVVGDRPNDRDE